MSGHNKWSTIKRKKEANDAKRSKMFTKIIKDITIAVREGGPDPDSNPRLRLAIANARGVNMPKDNIDRAISSAEASADEKVVYEAYGPGGTAIIIEGLTDSRNRTSQEIKHLLSKNGGSLVAPGSAIWAFSKTPEGTWLPTTSVHLSNDDTEKLSNLIMQLEDHDDIQGVYTNVS